MTKSIFIYKNFRRGDFSECHAKVDVYAKGVKICDYQWNPFWQDDFKVPCGLLQVLASTFQMSLELFRKKNYFNIWRGNVWGKKLTDNMDKTITEVVWKNKNLFKCDPKEDDVMYALYTDITSYENAQDFEDWATDCGFDTDSRKAEKIYNQIGEEIENEKKAGIYDAIMEWGDTHPDY